MNSAPGSHAPTPLSTSFANNANVKDGAASSHPTPTPATATKAPGLTKKKKVAEDADSETREPKKVRTNFGAARK